MKYLLVLVSLVTLIAMGFDGTSVNSAAKSTTDNNQSDGNQIVSLNYTSLHIGTLVYVPPGSFQRNADADNISVITTEFRISATEITQAQYNAVMGSGGTANLPIENIGSYNVLVFCNKLSMMENLTPVYTISGSTDPAAWGTVPTASNATWNAATANWTANGYRLPTQMEWLWAAMGATSGHGYSGSGVYTTGISKLFAGSTGNNTMSDYVWYDANSNSQTHLVGTKLPNELGLYDMNGNTWEWVWDWAVTTSSGTYTGYGEVSPLIGTLTDYRGPTPPGSGLRLMRGGGYNDSSGWHGILAAMAVTPMASFGGIRVVRL